MPTLSIRIDFDLDRRIGPGKIALLEGIGQYGSISAAGRAMAMSYKRAWELADETAKLCGRPVIVSQAGGKRGGGAKLTPFGQSLVTRYREIERAAFDAARPHIEILEREIAAE